jgi:hypothetical protein
MAGSIVFFLFRHHPQAGVSQRNVGDQGFRHRLVPGSLGRHPSQPQKSREFARKHGTFSGQKFYVFPKKQNLYLKASDFLETT